MRKGLNDLYKEREEKFSIQLADLNSRINNISNLRLLSALGSAVAIYFSFSYTVVAIAAIALIVVFLYLVKRHAVLFRERVHVENLVRINKNERRSLHGDFTVFAAGNEFIDPHHPYSHDLDIFGEGSLFQYLNRCNTIHGRRKLAFWLEEPLSDSETIRQRQESIKDLVPRIDFRQDAAAGSAEMEEQQNDRAQLLQWLEQPSILRDSASLRLSLWIIPALTIISLAATFFSPFAKIPLALFIVVQWILTGTRLKKINVFHDYIGRKKNILQKHAQFLFYVERESFKSTRLIEITQRAKDAHQRINEMASLVSALDARTNSMMTLVVNSLLLYDLQCVYRLERWKEKNADLLPVWLDLISEIEALNSLATYAFNNPDAVFASIHEELKIDGRDLAHPLISAEERVVNSFQLGADASIAIITGANMAGKSTFLRTVGVSVVLALSGAPVCASSFSCPVLQLRSGMRTTDSLKDHQSYFYAELNRLRSIMDELRSNKPLLILLDEILKGTNSNDKQAGSIALVKQLLPYPCLALIATHDLALGDLEHEFPGRVRNLSFEANIENDQLSFDYKLKNGMATKMNASFLMRKMGIIPE